MGRGVGGASVWLSALLMLLTVRAEAADPVAIRLANERWTGDLPGMVQRRYVRVLVPYGRTLYFVDLEGRQRGISFEFMRAFERHLNEGAKAGALPVHVVFIPASRDKLLAMLKNGEGDVVAANFTITPARQREVDFAAPVAGDVRELIITGPGAPPLPSLDALSGQEIYVLRGSSYAEHLQELNRDLARRGLKPARLREAPGHFETEDVVEMVNAGLVRIAVADDYLARFWSQAMPKMVVRDDLVLHRGGEVSFAIRQGSPQLKAALDGFVKTHRRGTAFGNVTLARYLRQPMPLGPATAPDDLRRFQQMVELFRRYGGRYDVDWLLMAAQGYQESQLQQSRRSHVGAIGVMQVMPATARELGVGNVAELEPNIHAGVKYVRFLVDRYFAAEPMTPTDRVLFAFAAYNAGPARVRALRREAQARGLDPNLWFDNVERVAADRIGRETVQYVSNIYKYYVAYALVQEEFATLMPSPR
jgi:membrane-bound lytic murein transglycosylase MltF